MTDLVVLERTCRLLPEPANYYAGLSIPPGLLPRAVLLFHRKQAMGSTPALHHRFVMPICFRGDGAVVVDGRLHAVGPEQGLLIFPHQSHFYLRLQGKPVSWLFMTFELDEGDCLLPLRDTPFRLPTDGWALVERIVNAFASDGASDCPYHLALLLTRLLRQQNEYVARRARPASPEDPRWALLRRVTRCVHRRIGEGLHVEDVAQEVALSASHLRALFRQTMGISLGSFIRSTALHKACSYLHASDMNVSQIAEACGFQSVYAFSRAFRRDRGESPSAYRRRMRGASSNPTTDDC